MTDVKLALRGLRGESFADIARRTGQIAGNAVAGGATDQQVLDLLTDDAAASAAAAAADRVQTGLDAAATAADLADALAIQALGDDAAAIAARAAKSANLGDVASLELANRNLGTFATRALAAAATIPVVLTSVELRGFAAAGDGGQAVYARVGSEPSHPGKFQSADGAWWELAGPVVNIKQFGGVGDGFTDESTAVNALHAYAVAMEAAGKAPVIVWPQGLYSYATSPNWGSIGRLHMHFQGEVWLAKYGAGPAFIIDGGTTPGVSLIGIQITGFPMIYNDSANDHCVFARAIGDSLIQVNCRSASPTHAGFYGEWLVDNDLHIICSGLEGGMPSSPAKGIHLTTRGVAEDSSYNRIYVRISGDAVTHLPIGIYLDAALGNEIRGTAQNCDLGYQDTSNAWENVLFKTDFEANTDDAEVFGQQTQFLHCDFEVGPVFKSGSVCGKMIGGATQNVTVESGAVDTLLSSFTYNRLRVSGTGAITDAGTRTRYRDLLNGTDGVVHDAPPSRTALTVGASPFTYTNTGGNAVRVHVYGGVVTTLELSRFAGDLVPVSGFYTLEPGESLIVTYSSLPAVVVRT